MWYAKVGRNFYASSLRRRRTRLARFELCEALLEAGTQSNITRTVSTLSYWEGTVFVVVAAFILLLTLPVIWYTFTFSNCNLVSRTWVYEIYASRRAPMPHGSTAAVIKAALWYRVSTLFTQCLSPALNIRCAIPTKRARAVL